MPSLNPGRRVHILYILLFPFYDSLSFRCLSQLGDFLSLIPFLEVSLFDPSHYCFWSRYLGIVECIPNTSYFFRVHALFSWFKFSQIFGYTLCYKGSLEKIPWFPYWAVFYYLLLAMLFYLLIYDHPQSSVGPSSPSTAPYDMSFFFALSTCRLRIVWASWLVSIPLVFHSMVLRLGFFHNNDGS